MKRQAILLSLVAFLLLGCEKKEEAKEQSVQRSETQKSSESPKIKVIQGATQIEKENPLIGYDIDGNRVVKIAPDGEETELTKKIGALATIRNNYENLNAKILSQSLSKEYILHCSACHDDYANGVIGPSLLDKNGDEIYKMIMDYKSSAKANVFMKELVAKMKDEQIRAIADEISEFNKELREKQ